MEVHISSNDNNFVTNICNDIRDRLSDLKGYACFSGYNFNCPYEYKVFKSKDDISSQFPKFITFGDMINLMKQSKGLKLYFQREDWRGTHNFISLNDSDGRNIYIEQFYEDKRYRNGDQFFDENGIPISDSKPYIPSYDDMFIHSWILCDFEKREQYEKEEEVDYSDSTL